MGEVLEEKVPTAQELKLAVYLYKDFSLRNVPYSENAGYLMEYLPFFTRLFFLIYCFQNQIIRISPRIPSL